MERTFRAVLEDLPAVTAYVDEWLESLGCSLKAQMQIDVAVDELFSNIARYAYAPGGGEAVVRLEYYEAEQTASLTFVDGGVAFDPLQKADPDVSLSVEERKIGGLGIFLVKRTMDGIAYRREGNRNVLTIRKRIG